MYPWKHDRESLGIQYCPQVYIVFLEIWLRELRDTILSTNWSCIHGNMIERVYGYNIFHMLILYSWKHDWESLGIQYCPLIYLVSMETWLTESMDTILSTTWHFFFVSMEAWFREYMDTILSTNLSCIHGNMIARVFRYNTVHKFILYPWKHDWESLGMQHCPQI